MDRCLATVRDWAQRRNFDYRLEGDRLVSIVPEDLRARLRGHIAAISDQGRLRLVQEAFAEGYTRVIWFDADVVVFDPEHLRMEYSGRYCLGYELWLRRNQAGDLVYTGGPNCSFLQFDAGNPFLPFLLHALEQLTRHRPGLPLAYFSTQFLAGLAQAMPLPVHRGIGNFSPLLVADLAGEGRLLAEYMRRLGNPLRAANLCVSKRGVTEDGVTITDAMHEQACLRLIESRGEILNRHVAA